MDSIRQIIFSFYQNYFCYAYSQIKKSVCKRSKKKTLQPENSHHLYDISADVLKLIYFVQGNAHKICISRDKPRKDIRQIYQNITENHKNQTYLEYPVIYAQFNDSIDITERVNSYLGNRGCHLELGENIKIRWILTPTEIKEFRKLSLFTSNMKDIEFFDIDEPISF